MTVKFITLNIWQGGNLLDEALLFLQEKDPDILLMQEVYDGKNFLYEQKYRTFDLVRKILSFPYASFSPAFLDTRTIGNINRGNAVFSKFPILGNTTITYDLPYGKFDEEHPTSSYEKVPMCIEHAVLLIQGNKYNIYNLQGIWGKDGKDNERRLKMSKVLVEEVKDKERVILAGDFNLNPDTKTIRNVEKYLRNVFKNKLPTTFNMKQKKKLGFAESVVDMVFVSHDVNVIDCSCPQVDISDHLPLVCDLEL